MGFGREWRRPVGEGGPGSSHVSTACHCLPVAATICNHQVPQPSYPFTKSCSRWWCSQFFFCSPVYGVVSVSTALSPRFGVPTAEGAGGLLVWHFSPSPQPLFTRGARSMCGRKKARAGPAGCPRAATPPLTEERGPVADLRDETCYRGTLVASPPGPFRFCLRDPPPRQQGVAATRCGV